MPLRKWKRIYCLCSKREKDVITDSNNCTVNTSERGPIYDTYIKMYAYPKLLAIKKAIFIILEHNPLHQQTLLLFYLCAIIYADVIGVISIWHISIDEWLDFRGQDTPSKNTLQIQNLIRTCDNIQKQAQLSLQGHLCNAIFL